MTASIIRTMEVCSLSLLQTSSFCNSNDALVKRHQNNAFPLEWNSGKFCYNKLTFLYPLTTPDTNATQRSGK